MNKIAILFPIVFIMPFPIRALLISNNVQSNDGLAIVAKSGATLTAVAVEEENISAEAAKEVGTNQESMNDNSKDDPQVKPDEEEGEEEEEKDKDEGVGKPDVEEEEEEKDKDEGVVEEIKSQIEEEPENNKDDEKIDTSSGNGDSDIDADNEQIEATKISQSSTTDTSITTEEEVTAREESNTESFDYQEDQRKPNDDGINEGHDEVTKNIADNQLNATTDITSKGESDIPPLKNNSIFKCYACNGLIEANCTTSPMLQIDCKPVLTPMTERGCYTLVEGSKANITRGCISDLAQEGIAYCKKHVKLCVLCFSDGCNNRTLIASNNVARQLSYATLASLLLLALSNAYLW